MTPYRPRRHPRASLTTYTRPPRSNTSPPPLGGGLPHAYPESEAAGSDLLPEPPAAVHQPSLPAARWRGHAAAHHAAHLRGAPHAHSGGRGTVADPAPRPGLLPRPGRGAWPQGCASAGAVVARDVAFGA